MDHGALLARTKTQLRQVHSQSPMSPSALWVEPRRWKCAVISQRRHGQPSGQIIGPASRACMTPSMVAQLIARLDDLS
jgi:hypothetical protein